MDSSTVLQSREMDVIMAGTELLHHQNMGQLQSPFMDPRVLNQVEDVDTPSSNGAASSAEQVSDESQPTSNGSKLSTVRNHPTGCCYDDRMKLHANADFGTAAHHPEDPRRIEEIMKVFKGAGLVYTGSTFDLNTALKTNPNQWLWRIPARPATQAEICLAHTAGHFEWVRALSEKPAAELRSLTAEYDRGRKSLYVANLTYEAALISAGGAIEACKNVVEGRVKNAIAVIRPPGHHAEHNESLGFCIFNNVSIAAKVCLADYPEVCRKILVLDWDVHHGNGIQNIFYEDPNVLYISIHVFSTPGGGTFYPGDPEEPGIPDGNIDKCGAARGIGKNVNIGWTDQGVGDGEYMAAFQKIVMPIAQEFDPDLVIVASGFDAAAGDDLGCCWVSPECYSHMTHMLMSLADGKVAVCLEGGYNLRAISRSALAVVKTLMGEPPQRMVIPPLNKEAAHTLDNVKRIQASYWNCMRPGVVPLPELQERGTQRASDLFRLAQKSILGDKYNMIPLYVQRSKLSASFENQILATPEMHKATKLLVIIHDPPELLAQPDPTDNTVYSHNAFVTDGIEFYIDWAVKNGYGVIDINIPQHVSSPDDSLPFIGTATENYIQVQTKELLCYLWDNYFEINQNCSITLMGVGDAYLGVKQLLTSRDCRQRIPGILSFVSGSLRPVRSETDQYLSAWYKANSQIYVSPDHACWNHEESARKVRKSRFGKVEMADIELGVISGGAGGSGGVGAGGVVGLMLKRYEAEATAYIAEKVAKWEEEHEDPDETEDEDNEYEELGRGKQRSRRVPVA